MCLCCTVSQPHLPPTHVSLSLSLLSRNASPLSHPLPLPPLVSSITGARVRPGGEQARATVRAEGREAGQAHTRDLQPEGPHRYSRRRPRRGQLSQAVTQSSKDPRTPWRGGGDPAARPYRLASGEDGEASAGRFRLMERRRRKREEGSE